MEYVSLLGVIVAVYFYVSESSERQKTEHYQAWQVINSAHGQRSGGGRIQALQDLNKDKVSLAGIDLSRAVLEEIQLELADLRGADLSGAFLINASLSGAQLFDTNLSGTELSDAKFMGAGLRSVNLRDIRSWERIKSIKFANIYEVKNPPKGFIEWATKSGAVSINSDRW